MTKKIATIPDKIARVSGSPFDSLFLHGVFMFSAARYRLACLWVSQVARVVADNCLRMFVVLLVAHAGLHTDQEAWHRVTAFFVLPFILLAPINGMLANSLPKRWVLVGSSAYCLAVTLLLRAVLPPTPAYAWWWCGALALNMIGAVVYSPTRYALLPAAAQDAGEPLPRVNGWMEMGGAAGVVLGLMVGVDLFASPNQLFPALGMIAFINLVSLLAALPASFLSDVRRPEPPGQAIAGFFRDAKRIWNQPDCRNSMLGLAAFLALVVAGSGAIFAAKGAFAPDVERETLVHALALVGLGAAVGSLTAGLQGHPYRTLGLIPYGAVGMVGALVWAALADDLVWPCLLLGFTGGLVNVPLRATFQASVAADARGNALAISNLCNYLFIDLFSGLMFVLVYAGWLSPAGQLWLLVLLAGIGAVVSWRMLLRPALEQTMEILLMPIYRMSAAGPGVGKVPLDGPVLIVANHTAWFDPMWLGKVIPRKIVPMMGSGFYDLPFMRWLMASVVGAIRIQESKFRREAPELAEGIALLDRGGCLVLFPEGRLRRVPEPSVRQFGRGVWHILHERPKTPVVVCWIEGGWGSYVSYCNGHPTKNKRPDFWRQIQIAVSEPQILPDEILADPRSTRTYLMQACLNARGYLGLAVPALEDGKELPTEEPENEAAEERR